MSDLLQSEVESGARDCVIKALQPNTRYLIYMTARSTHYESDHSNKVLVSTSGKSEQLR